ncbi:MAG: NADH dehydrogenase subunit [Rikenellaceae bacterium]|nr:NADH dehydrogenase subunit [Rikenellaceae bacterium]
MKWLTTYNRGGSVALEEIPVAEYGEFYTSLCDRLADPACHIADYFAVKESEGLRFFCLLMDDKAGTVDLASFRYGYYDDRALESVTAVRPEAHPFERAVTEQTGVRFRGNPWAKPLRYPSDGRRGRPSIDRHPFYTIAGDALHEVNVGPIHAGIIEPGAFRFICNGEKVLHLEISLGYQHRGIERLITTSGNRLRQTVLAESIAGDTAVGHSTACVTVIEKLAAPGLPAGLSARLAAERAVAIELERIAMHIADTGALCMDIGYQLGQVACEALRTIVINTTLAWCGNRFGKGLVRPFGTRYPITPEVADRIRANLAGVVRRYREVREDLKSAPSVLARFEDCGIVSAGQLARIGAVGMAARAGGLKRDVRFSHPYGPWTDTLGGVAEFRTQGDVMARLMLRGREIFASAGYVTALLDVLDDGKLCRAEPVYDVPLRPLSLAYSLTEGWRGEICHTAVTDRAGALAAYKVKDPSVHNWLALALAMRGEGISDFPINNKSFNLSYCGHDL